MKFEFLDKKTVVIRVESEEDLITLFKVINPEDIVSGYDYRVISIGERKERKKVWIKLKVEDINFSEYSDSLRISGRIVESSEEVQGHFHTFDVRVGSEITLFKEKGFKKYEIEELNRKRYKREFFIVSLDSNSISVAKLNYKLEILLDEDINVPKDHPERESIIESYYKKAVDLLKDAKVIVVVGPVFYPEKFRDYLSERFRDKNILTFRISLGGISGIYEFINRTEYLKVLGELEIAEINEKIEDFIVSVTKNKGCFGIDDLLEKIDYCNLEYVLLSYEWFRRIKSDRNYLDKILRVLEKADECNIEVYFVRRENKNFEFIDKFGIVGKVRY
ncbi:MAG: hypothetical protein BXU00_02115 [Candidatus Nanoclepta minutus]|uniref:eRF1/Pelota-like N-terminal domain-containing protein n=1 Tax=Candidatus Nanoclepta minutus TaxID=1940235 RepID=A0A397WQD8_9ARCH|nr:MAG: hypothetical protein BXU00_02115 [Candidatus Nanoclepta minutus]